MNSFVLQISGTLVEDGQTIPFSATIYRPVRESSSADFSCQVEAKELFDDTIAVRGVTETQAIRLSLILLFLHLSQNICDEDGGSAIWDQVIARGAQPENGDG